MRGCGTVFRDDPPPELNDFDELILENVERLARKLRWQADQIDLAISHSRMKQSTEGLSTMVAFVFNAQQHNPNFGGGGEQLPPGKKYKGVIVESGTDRTGDGNGGFLWTKIGVVEGPLQGKTQMIRFNLHNTNPKTVEIANEQLSALCHAVGVFNMQDTQQLHDKPFLFDVDWQKGHEPGGPKGGETGGYTEVKALYDVAGNKPGKGGGQAQNQGGNAGNSGYNGGPPAGGVQAQGNWGNAGNGQNNGGNNGGPPPQDQNQGGQNFNNGQNFNQGGGQNQGGNNGGYQVDNNVQPPQDQNNQGQNNGGGQAGWGNQNQGGNNNGGQGGGQGWGNQNQGGGQPGGWGAT